MPWKNCAYLVGGVLVLCLLAGQVYAAGSGENAYARGLAAMRAGDYAEAIQYLDAAQQAGVRHTRLHYNRGVSLYRLGRYDEAELAFEAVAMDPPMAPMAYFNLGLISERRGDAVRARQWFERALRETDDESLRTVARRKLSGLGENGDAGVRAASRWSGEWSAALGYDSNVLFINEDLAAASGTGDRYLDLYGAADYTLRGGRRDGWTLGMTAELTDYQDYSEDYRALGANLFYRRQAGMWSGRAGALVEQSQFGSDDYQRKTGLRLRLEHEAAAERRLTLGYDFARLDDLEPYYRHLSGTSQRFRIDSAWRRGDRTWRAGYALELNDRNDLTDGVAFTSYSATRHNLAAGVRFDFAARWAARLDAEYRFSRYNDADRDAGGADLGQREDHRWRTSARFIHMLNRGLDVVLWWRYIDNASNVAQRDYQRTVTSLGLEGRF
ncbi:MAG: tetratricopeptide repeat protein [Pseudomonadota bacterium]